MDWNWFRFAEVAKEKDIICYGAGSNALFMLADVNFRPFLAKIRCFVDKDSRKHGKKLTIDALTYDIYPIDKIDDHSDCIVLVTLTDYFSVGKILEEKGTLWFPWTVIATDFIFNVLSINRKDDTSAIFLLNTPDYVNLGDQAIAYAEDIYLRKYFGSYYEFGTHSCHASALNRLKEYVKPNDLILVQGGGNIGSLWRICEEIFRDVLLKFPNNPVIVFPQSIFYGNTEEERAYFAQSKKIYDSHKKLLICTRDKRSYDFVQKSYNCKCMLLPDMVLTIKPERVLERKGIGVLLRSDKEQALPDAYVQIVHNVIKMLDEKEIVLTHHPIDPKSDRASRVEKILKEYASCRLIITDRLHGMIFAAITNTPCIAFDNSYCKVSSVYETWLEECTYITVSKPLEEKELLKAAKVKLELGEVRLKNSNFEEYFAPLTEYVKSLMKRGK